MTDDDKTKRFFQAINAMFPGSDLTVLLRHEPEPGARPNECFTNCQRKVCMSGGAMQCGWIFGGSKEGNYVVVSAHAVWRSPEGLLIDITPVLAMDNLPKKVIPPLRDTGGYMLFLPDDEAFERPNRFVPLCKNKVLVRSCRRLNRKEWELWHSPDGNSRRVEKVRKSCGWHA